VTLLELLPRATWAGIVAPRLHLACWGLRWRNWRCAASRPFTTTRRCHRHRAWRALLREAEALGRAAGSGLRSLVLDGCTLAADAWPALARHLPVLGELEL
jgi:hypothetical protein